MPSDATTIDAPRDRDLSCAGAMDDVYSKPGHLIRRLQQIAVAVFAQECAERAITPVQYAALVAVRDNPGLDATRIASLIAFDRSTLGSVLERLEGKGLIERRAKADDRRIKILKISRRGERVLAEVEPSVRIAQERMLEPLGDEDRAHFLSLMRRIIEQHDTTSRGGQNGDI